MLFGAGQVTYRTAFKLHKEGNKTQLLQAEKASKDSDTVVKSSTIIPLMKTRLVHRGFINRAEVQESAVGNQGPPVKCH